MPERTPCVSGCGEQTVLQEVLDQAEAVQLGLKGAALKAVLPRGLDEPPDHSIDDLCEVMLAEQVPSFEALQPVHFPEGSGQINVAAPAGEARAQEAAIVQKEGIKVRPEIMIPLVGFKKELDLQIAVVHEAAKQVQAERKVKLNYLVGTMIEVPRGALTADEIAQSAEFFSFGTNDLTQTGLGMSRDDSGSFLPAYQELEIMKNNPFASLDQTGVGQLVDIAVVKGRQTRPDIKLGICGEHGGDPSSIHFFEKVGLNYVSCSPYRVPVARLAAAQAALSSKAGN